MTTRCIEDEIRNFWGEEMNNAKKITDNRNGRLDLWAADPRPGRLPRLTNPPRFKSRKFNSWEDFNVWKRELLLSFADGEGAKWTS